MNNPAIKIDLPGDPAIYALIVLLMANIGYSYYWVGADTAPPGWDQASHMISALAYHYAMAEHSPDMFSRMLSIDFFYPPFFPFSAAVLYFFSGRSSDAAVMVNSIYAAVLIFSIYGIGSRTSDRRTGLAAAILISLFPAAFNLQRDFLLDFPLTAMVSLAIFSLISCEYFNDRKYSLVFGASLALAMLTKWTAILFIAGPLCFVFIKGRMSGAFGAKSLSNLSLSMLIAIVLAGIWYIPNLSNVYNLVIVGQQSAGAFEGDPGILTVRSFAYYLHAIVNSASFFFFIIFIAGSVLLFKKSKGNALLLYSVLVVPYVAFTLFRNKDVRYILPALIPISIIAGIFISSTDNKKLFRPLLLAVFIFGIVQLFPGEAGTGSVSIETPSGPLFLFGPAARTPNAQDWKVKEVLLDIYADAGTNSRVLARGYASIGVVPDMLHVNGLTYRYYSYSNKLPFNVVNCAYLNLYEFMDNMTVFDYMLLKSGRNKGSRNDRISEIMNGYFYEMKGEKYILFRQYDLPDNTTLFTYKNILR